MKRFLYGLVLICMVLAALVSAGWAAPPVQEVQLCPQADRYRLQRSFYLAGLKEVVHAPHSVAEVSSCFVELAAKDPRRRQAAISALALAGNVELFEQLLEEGDSEGMATYAARYLRADGALCLDPRLEEALVQHLHDPRFSGAFLAFFPHNLYSSRALFESLLPLLQYDDKEPEQYGRLMTALAATRLPGLVPQMLEVAQVALFHGTPARKRVMPQVHRSLVSYFASQQAPVFAYFKAVLAAESRSERVEYFQKNYALTRQAVYQVLKGYDAQESFDVFLEELAELADEPWGPFFFNDLRNLLSHLEEHPLFGENKEAVLSSFARLLATPSLPDQPGFRSAWERSGEPELYDVQVRRELYAVVARIDSAAAGNLLLDELERLGRRPATDSRTVLIVELLQGVAVLAETSGVDVGRLVALSGPVQGPGEVVHFAEVLARHRHPEGFAALLERFVAAWGTGEPMAPSEHNPVVEALFSVLLRVGQAEDLLRVRAAVDALFQEGRLSEAVYRAKSSILTAALGEDDFASQALLQAKIDGKLQQDLIKAQVRWRQEMADELARQGSRAAIAANINALGRYGDDAKKAAYWLIRVGLPVLSQAHAALEDPGATAELKSQLIAIMGAIGDISSTPFIIAAASTRPFDTMILKEAFLALARIPQSSESLDFARHWLEAPEGSSLIKSSALAYFAGHRDPRGLQWSEQFAGVGQDPALRATALYLAALLGDGGSLEHLVGMLAAGQENAVAYLLWRGLAEICTVLEFADLVEELRPERSWELEQIEQYVRWRNSVGEEKKIMADALLTARVPFYSETVAAFLLANEQFGQLTKYFRIGEPFPMSLEMVLFVSAVAQRIFTETRRQGYTVVEQEGEICFLPLSKE